MTKKLHFERSDVEALIAVLSAHRYYAADDGGMGDNCQCGFDVTHEGLFDNDPESLNRSHDEHVAALLSLSPTPTGDERARLRGLIGDESNYDRDPDSDGWVFNEERAVGVVLAAGFRVTPEPVYEYGVTDEQVERLARVMFAHTTEGRNGFTWPLNGEPDRVRDMERARATLGRVLGLPVEGEK